MKSITIAGTSYPLKFGMGGFKKLSEYWEIKGLQGVINEFENTFSNMSEDMEFDTLDRIADLVNAGIENAGGECIDRSDILDEIVLRDSTKLQMVIDTFIKSIPGAENGKKKVSQKKQPKPVKKKATKKT